MYVPIMGLRTGSPIGVWTSDTDDLTKNNTGYVYASAGLLQDHSGLCVKFYQAEATAVRVKSTMAESDTETIGEAYLSCVRTKLSPRRYFFSGATLSMTCSSPRRPLRSHSLVCSENHLFIVGIGPIRDKEL